MKNRFITAALLTLSGFMAFAQKSTIGVSNPTVNGLYATTANGTSGSQLIKFDGTTWSVETTAQSSAGGLTGIWFVKNMLYIDYWQ